MSTPPSAPSAEQVAISPLTDRERRNYASFARDALKQGAPQTLTLARIIQEYEATLDALSTGAEAARCIDHHSERIRALCGRALDGDRTKGILVAALEAIIAELPLSSRSAEDAGSGRRT